MIKDFISGAGYLIQGARLVTKPEFRRFIIIPVLINVIVFSAAIWLGTVYFETMLDWLLPESTAWWFESARTAIWILFGMIVMLITFFTFTIAANIIGAPFNGLLSERVEERLSGKTPGEGEGSPQFISTIVPAVSNEFKKLYYFTKSAAVIFILMLIPGLNIIAPFAWIAFTSWMLALEYVSYPMENHNMFFSIAREKMKGRKGLTFGFGLTVMLATAIPLINFVVMPSAVAGATAMWLDRLRD